MIRSTLSLVIITKNREKQLVRCLKSISKQTIQPNETVIIEDTSNQKKFSESKLKTYLPDIPKIKYISVKNGNYAISRNIGLKKALCDIVYFVDDDVILPMDNIKKITTLHKKYPNALGFVGKVKPLKSDIYSLFGSFYIMNICRFKKKIFPITNYAFISISLNRDCIMEKGVNFDVNFSTGEDNDFLTNMNLKSAQLYFSPNLTVTHEFKSNIFSFAKRNFEYAKDFATFNEKYPSLGFINEYLPTRKFEFLFLPYFFLKFIYTRVNYFKMVLKLNNKFIIPITIQAISNLLGVYSSKKGLQTLRIRFDQVFLK